MPSFDRSRKSPIPAGPDEAARRNGHSSAVPTRGCIAITADGAVLRTLKTSESLAREVVRTIIDQGLQPGDGLPTEGAMLEQYGVSRESLREGLRLLEVQGLISIRRGPGGGPVVGSVHPANLGRISTLYFHMAGATYNELFDAWMFAECILAERAARASDRTARVAAMAPYLELNEVRETPEELARFVQEHAMFHGAVASLVGNRVLELTLQTMGQIVSHHVATVDDPRIMHDLIADDHLRLARAIAAGHSGQASTFMRDHIEGVARYTRERLGARMDDLIEWQ
ncbi:MULTISPECIES: FadR/GntR family transcriptional regulator [unclassified Frankia]|uniref:FadR/GntR family transcriptional regulator n=1 Tax=unclassified Frankia TaxID=2632575 RepID=UPI002AD40983|nr:MULTISPECIES: GntR family transcriptional regulator [unclassified Frankia]